MPALPPIPFTKPPLSLPDQLRLLETRGLEVNDRAAATHYLAHIGYYRLSGYALPFQKGGSGPDRHDFRTDVTFDDILDRYVFDRKLRPSPWGALVPGPAALQPVVQPRRLHRRYPAADRP